jgi:hypothetical protein
MTMERMCSGAAGVPAHAAPRIVQDAMAAAVAAGTRVAGSGVFSSQARRS